MTKAISVDQSHLMDKIMYYSELHKTDEFQALLYSALDEGLNLQEAIKIADEILLKKLNVNTDLQGAN